MSGRIRTIKPEWLDDELLASTSSDARVLSVALLLLADDYGNGRASVSALAAEVWKFDMSRDDGAHATAVVQRARAALAELAAARFVSIYEVAGQKYYAVRNWAKHQRVDKPGKPRVPGPDTSAVPAKAATPKRIAYFVRGSITGLIKIGESADPVARLVELAKAGSERLDLLAVGGVESEHHVALADDRVHGEWFRPSPAVLAKVREYGGDVDKPIASAGYDGSARTLSGDLEKIREGVAKVPDSLATDLDQRPGPGPTTASVARARVREAPPMAEARANLDAFEARCEAVRVAVDRECRAVRRSPPPPACTAMSHEVTGIARWLSTAGEVDVDAMVRRWAHARDRKGGWAPLRWLSNDPTEYAFPAPSESAVRLTSEQEEASIEDFISAGTRRAEAL